jgi:hypothetical protein
MANRYHIFISYSQKDGDVAASLASRLDEAGLRCFMADRSILAASEWEPQLREALLASDSVLLLITPRSKDSLWVAAEAGAAWVLHKQLIPVLMFVEPQQLFEPIRKYEARLAETPEQMDSLIRELRELSSASRSRAAPPTKATRTTKSKVGERFTGAEDWQALLKVGEWSRDPTSGMITGGGMYRYLLSHKIYGPSPFKVRCRLTFEQAGPEVELGSVNSGIVLGWNASQHARQYYHLMFTGRRLLLEQIGFRVGGELDYQHLDEGVSFPLRPRREYEIELGVSATGIHVQIDGKHIYSVVLHQPMSGGRVGLRPWRCLAKCAEFVVSAAERDSASQPAPS